MDGMEEIGMVWEALASAGTMQTVDEIMRSTGLETVPVRRVLVTLRRLSLVEVTSPAPSPSYQAAQTLSALQWAQAVEAGIPLSILERTARLGAKPADALRVASDGTLHKLQEKDRRHRARQREDLLAGRAASKAASSDLAQITQDLSEALKQPASKGMQGRAERMLLERAHDQASRAYQELLRRLRGS